MRTIATIFAIVLALLALIIVGLFLLIFNNQTFATIPNIAFIFLLIATVLGGLSWWILAAWSKAGKGGHYLDQSGDRSTSADHLDKLAERTSAN